MFPETLEECAVEDVEFIKSDMNKIVLESEIDEANWEEIKNNPDGFFDYVSSEIYERFDEALKSDYANYSVCSSDVIEHEFIIERNYLARV